MNIGRNYRKRSIAFRANHFGKDIRDEEEILSLPMSFMLKIIIMVSLPISVILYLASLTNDMKIFPLINSAEDCLFLWSFKLR